MIPGSATLGSRPLASSPRLPRAFRIASVVGEYGWATWSFSRQAKLNAWSWSGIGSTNIYAWATLGNVLYVRKESDSYVHALSPDVFYTADDTNTESTSVEITTQWLDFGKPGKMKALSGVDFDCQNVTTLEVYVSENGGRTGTLAATIAVSDTDTGWTYNGEVIPLDEAGAATEFMLRFIGDGNLEVQVNRITLYYDEITG